MAEETPSSLVTQRHSLESEFAEALGPEVEAFMARVQAAASSDDASDLTLAFVLALWASAIEAAQARLGGIGQALLSFAKDHPLPSLALTAALWARSQSVALGDDAATAKLRLATVLGLARDPLPGLGGAWGRVLADGQTLAWDKAVAELARTASTADFAASMLQQLRDEGYTHKRWATRYDSRVRDTHANADRQTIPLEENFTVGTASLRFPGDPMSSDIGEVINCRCVLIGVNFGSKYPEPGPENYR